MRHGVVIVTHVLQGAAVSLAEPFTEVPFGVAFDGGVLVHLMIIGVGAAVIGKVFACGFNAFVVAATLGIAILAWRLIPIVVVILIEGSTADGLRFMRGSFKRAR